LSPGLLGLKVFPEPRRLAGPSHDEIMTCCRGEPAVTLYYRKKETEAVRGHVVRGKTLQPGTRVLKLGEAYSNTCEHPACIRLAVIEIYTFPLYTIIYILAAGFLKRQLLHPDTRFMCSVCHRKPGGRYR